MIRVNKKCLILLFQYTPGKNLMQIFWQLQVGENFQVVNLTKSLGFLNHLSSECGIEYNQRVHATVKLARVLQLEQ